MKAKILGLFFSVLSFVGYGQTIDGKLYTNFNNYYKWRGGAFDTTLLIPQTASPNGKRPGALYYNTTDSSVYSWSGSQWIKVTGTATDTTSLSNRINQRVRYTDTASMLSPYLRSANVTVPTLQQVTTAGNTTTNDIVFNTTSESLQILNDGGDAKLQITNSSAQLGSELNKYGLILSDDIYTKQLYRGTTTKSSSITLADSSGILTQRVAVNGTTYNTAANGVVDLGNVDTATVVKAYVTNAEAVTITKGQVVYIFGASGDRAAVKLARNTSDTFSSKTLGIVRADIAAGQAGWVTTQGQVSGINLGAYTAGDILWLDSVPGGFTKTKPVAPLHGVFVGVVERANVGNGLIYVKPQNGVEVDEIHDILITNKKIGDGIVYTGSLYENRQVVLKQDTIPLAVFNVGSAAATDTSAFSTSTLAGSFYLDGTDTMFITSYRVALQGTSASITPDVWFNDSLNVTAGGTKLVNSPSAITNLTTGTSVTPNTNKIPPGNFVFVRFSAVTTKPTYFTLTLFGYRIRKQ